MRLVSFLLIICLFLAPACTTVSQKQNAALSRAVYSTEKAISAGRYDLAAAYSKQATRLVVPPKKKPVVSPVAFKGTRYIILPEGQNGEKTLSIGSAGMDALLLESKAIAGQFRAENKATASVEADADKVLVAKEKTLEKADTAQAIARHSFWGRTFMILKLLAVAAAIGALCWFFPVVIPLLLSATHAVGYVFQAARLALAAFFTRKGGNGQ